MLSKWVVVILTVVQLTHSIPSPNALGSDLTVLINNDILGELKREFHLEYHADELSQDHRVQLPIRELSFSHLDLRYQQMQHVKH